MSDPHESYPPGAPVVAANGEHLGLLRHAYPRFLLVDQEQAHADLEIPVHAVDRIEDGNLYLSINREALTEVDDEESAGRRLETPTGEAT